MACPPRCNGAHEGLLPRGQARADLRTGQAWLLSKASSRITFPLFVQPGARNLKAGQLLVRASWQSTSSSSPPMDACSTSGLVDPAFEASACHPLPPAFAKLTSTGPTSSPCLLHSFASRFAASMPRPRHSGCVCFSNVTSPPPASTSQTACPANHMGECRWQGT